MATQRQRPYISRRGLLSSGLSLGALGAGLLGTLGAAPPSSKRLILVMVDGGWDVTFGIDPKPGSPYVDGPAVDRDPEIPEDVESLQTYGAFPVQINSYRRPQVENLFQTYHNRLCVINGVWVGTVSHFEARTRMLTGTDVRSAPDIATIAGVVAGADKPIAAMDLSGLGRVGPYGDRTAMSGRRGQLSGVVDPGQRMPSDRHPTIRGISMDDEDRTSFYRFLDERWAADPRRGYARGEEIFAAQQESLARAERLLGMTIPNGSVNTLQDQMLLAIDLLEAGVCQTVTVGSLSFDSHSDGENQHLRWDELCGDLGYLISQMDERGLFANTIVAVLSEFGRTPLRNIVGGTDHFPHTSAMLFGSGIAGNRLIGATNDRVQSLPINFETGAPDTSGDYLRPNQLVAGILDALDVDPGEWLPGVEPFRAFRA